ncbi:MAG: S-methyl-5-thioribose-1-phosphate isomerase [Planctomycetota bacterium]|jgi:methylthioribose-1-phosphate isomerase
MTIKLPPRSVEWIGELDGHVRMIDQTKLPEELTFLECRDPESIWHAIKRLSVRGAPAIGIAAAMGAVLGARNYDGERTEGLQAQLRETCDYLATSRPTAVNLFWALNRMQGCADRHAAASANDMLAALLEEAKQIRDEDAAMCRSIGDIGLPLIQEGDGVLTHCNAGSLATAEYGTALAPLYRAHEKKMSFRVFAGETRPLLQGARLTAWELGEAGIDVTLLCDNMAAALMREGKVTKVITGADRIAANGDAANKIGTYGVAVLARAHDIPFYVAAPSSTFDLSLSSGDEIPIEERDPDEIRRGFGKLTSPSDVNCYSPAFDVTPAEYIAGIITECGMIQPVNRENVLEVLNS